MMRSASRDSVTQKPIAPARIAETVNAIATSSAVTLMLTHRLMSVAADQSAKPSAAGDGMMYGGGLKMLIASCHSPRRGAAPSGTA